MPRACPYYYTIALLSVLRFRRKTRGKPFGGKGSDVQNSELAIGDVVDNFFTAEISLFFVVPDSATSP
jgi:hypothetical protein